MRLSLGLLPLLLLGACASEEEQRAELARAMVRECLDGVARSTAEQSVRLPAGIDTDRICACAIKKTVDGKDSRALRRLASDGPGPGELDARGACIVEEARRTHLVGE